MKLKNERMKQQRALKKWDLKAAATFGKTPT
jgi:hypothetical protein